jgi:hypothetical protein
MAHALELMQRFADRTGITSDEGPRRYLWTDAFAVCNFIGLSELDLAKRLVDQVHHVLGRGDEEHPTRGGIRIGKPLPERGPDEPYDPELDWDRDGQYFHYLTKWMHALDCIARATEEASYHLWARELADVAHRAFTYGPPGNRRMFWKLGTDLSRPQLRSMGQHDPLDGLVTCMELDATATDFGWPKQPNLGLAIADYAEMIDTQTMPTHDPLGIGGLLFDAYRLARTNGRPDALLDAAAWSLRDYEAAPQRLAFRELGLAIGLEAADRLHTLHEFLPLRDEIVAFWAESAHRSTREWHEHEDIDDVMLATALAPDGFLSVTWRDAAQPGRPRMRSVAQMPRR